MKKLLSLALAAQMFVMIPAEAQYRRGPPVAPPTYQARPSYYPPRPSYYPAPQRHRHGLDLGDLGKIGAAIMIATAAVLVISKLSAGDRRVLDTHAVGCANGFERGACGKDVYLPDFNGPVQIRPHQRVYYRSQPNIQCRAMQVVQVNGSRVDVRDTRYLCYQNNQWAPPQASWGQPLYFDQPGMSPSMRRWDYFRPGPAVVGPAPGVRVGVPSGAPRTAPPSASVTTSGVGTAPRVAPPTVQRKMLIPPSQGPAPRMIRPDGTGAMY